MHLKASWILTTDNKLAMPGSSYPGPQSSSDLDLIGRP